MSGETWREVIISLADEVLPDGQTRREMIALKAFALALRGVPWAIQFLVERCEGKAPQGIFIADGRKNPLEALSPEQIVALRALVESRLLQDDGSSSTKPESGSRIATGSPPTRET